MTNHKKEGNMLDLKEERKYEQLRELGQELHIPIPEHFITLEVFDKNGKLLQRHHQRSHSWTRNAYNMLFSQMAGKACPDATFEAGKLSAKQTNAIIQGGLYVFGQHPGTIDAGTSTGYRAAAGEDAKGILVGSGVNAEDFEDYVLQTPIAEGAGGGQLNHAVSEAHSISYAALTLKDELIRYFNNNGGISVDVNEVALVGDLKHPDSSSAATEFLVSRDHLASTVTVPDTGQLKVTYTIQLTYPS